MQRKTLIQTVRRFQKLAISGGKTLLGMVVVGMLALSTSPVHAQCLHRPYGHFGHCGPYARFGSYGPYAYYGNYGSYVPYANFAYWNSRSVAELRWENLEVAELARLIHNLRQDERAARTQLQSLVQQREALAKFCNGISSTTTQAALRKSLATLTQSTTIQHILQAELPPLPEGEFITHSWLPGIIQDDGSLVEAPPVLDVGPEGGDVSVCRVQLEETWGQFRKNFRRGERLSARDVDRFQQSVKGYTVAARPVLRRASEMARFHGQKHLDLLKDLAKRLENPAGQVAVSRVVNPNATAFSGGIVADLISHLLENNLSVRIGGRAHASLVALSEDLKSELNDQIASIEYRIEKYKAQNPAQNAALKARVAETQIPPSAAGLNSSHYGNPLPQPANLYAGTALAAKQKAD